jgi:hypothetical protein
VEKLALYCFLLSLAILSVTEVASKFQKKGKTISELITENLKAHVYTTRLSVIVVIVGFPLFVYLNWSHGWEVSD